MSDDLLRRLKEQHHNTNVLDGDLMREAAAEIEKLRAERDLWISRFEDFRKNAARLEEARSRPMRLVGSTAAAALKETNDDIR